MAVLIEAISVVVRVDAIQRVLGSWTAFLALVPNNTLCFDEDIARIGLMAEVDAIALTEILRHRGLIVVAEDASSEVAVADQFRGLLLPCGWIDVVEVEIGPGYRVAAALMRGSTSDELCCPSGWSFERSFSSSCGLALPHADNGLRFLRHDDGLDVYWNTMTNEEVFVGRHPG